MSRPRLLDLFCGAGGAAVGYDRAGFEVVGVDVRPQRHFPFRFWQADALELEPWMLGAFDAVHASPPCQAYSAGGNLWLTRKADDRHPDLIGPVRELLRAGGVPYVIENVERAPLLQPVTVCGRALGLGVRRHRLFEASVALMVPPCPGGHPGDWLSVFGGGALTRTPRGGQARIDGRHNGAGSYDGRRHATHAEASAAMGIDWMSRRELSEAIPPDYTELIGAQLLQAIR
jgi:DNA (cytosine-5)-methyltransferase 1